MAKYSDSWKDTNGFPKRCGLLAVGSPGQALHLLLQRLGETVLGSQLPSLRHHGNGANVHGALGAISKRLAALGVLGWHLNLHLEDGVGEHCLRKPHLNGLAGQMAIGAHDLSSVLTRVGIVLLGKDWVRNSCLHGAGEQHGGRSTRQSLLGKGLDALHVLVSLLWGRSIHAVQLRAAGHQVVAVVGPGLRRCSLNVSYRVILQLNSMPIRAQCFGDFSGL